MLTGPGKADVSLCSAGILSDRYQDMIELCFSKLSCTYQSCLTLLNLPFDFIILQISHLNQCRRRVNHRVRWFVYNFLSWAGISDLYVGIIHLISVIFTLLNFNFET